MFNQPTRKRFTDARRVVYRLDSNCLTHAGSTDTRASILTLVLVPPTDGPQRVRTVSGPTKPLVHKAADTGARLKGELRPQTQVSDLKGNCSHGHTCQI